MGREMAAVVGGLDIVGGKISQNNSNSIMIIKSVIVDILK